MYFLIDRGPLGTPLPPPRDRMKPFFSSTMMSGLFNFAWLPKKKCRLHWVIALERSLGAQYCIKGVYLFKHRKLQSISHRRIKFVDNYMELRLNFPFQQLSFRSESILSVKIQDGRHFFTKTENSLQAVHSCALSNWQNLQT